MKRLILITLLCPYLAFGQLSDCEPYFSTTLLEVNDIRARIGTPNVFFKNWGDAGFAVPAEDSIHSIYAMNDWIGGVTPDGTLHLSAGTYNSGGASDFFTGPLSSDGLAMTEDAICNGYSGLYRAQKVDALLHKEYYDRIDLVANGSDPAILTQPPFQNGYEPPEYFYSWPAHNENSSFDYYLAPFIDRGQDGHYDPDAGDYPGFDLEGTCSCIDPDLQAPSHLQGHEAIWQVYHDNGLHTETGGTPMGIEVQSTTFGFNHCGVLDEALFQRKRIINRSSNTYLDTYVGQWLDTDLGCPTDDFVGCDVSRGIAFTYNGDADDSDCDGVQGYGMNPPILSFQFLAGPYQDEDGIDNPMTHSVQDAVDSLGITYSGLGIGYGDNIIDNERIGIRRFTYYRTHNFSITYPYDIPGIASQYYQSLTGKWRDDSPVTYGGTGIGGLTNAQFMFPGTTDPLGYSTHGEITNGNWSESSEGHVPGNRMFVAVTGPFTFEPGEVQETVTALNWTAGSFEPDITYTSMQIESDVIQNQFEYCFQLVDGFPPVESFSYSQSENDFTFYLPYYYEYDAKWSFDDGFTGEGLSVSHSFQEEGDYDVCVTVYNCDGPTEICERITVTALDLEEITTDELILLYPNPVSEELFIHSTRMGTEISQVHIYDVKGRLMQSAEWNEEQKSILLDKLIGPGYYTARITYRDGLEKSSSFLKR